MPFGICWLHRLSYIIFLLSSESKCQQIFWFCSSLLCNNAFGALPGRLLLYNCCNNYLFDYSFSGIPHSIVFPLLFLSIYLYFMKVYVIRMPHILYNMLCKKVCANGSIKTIQFVCKHKLMLKQKVMQP